MVKRLNKSGVSLMVSYVLLVSIAIAMAVGVFFWLKSVSNVAPIISCEDGTSIVIEDYECNTNEFKMMIRNNGRFSVDGVIVSLGSDKDKTPTLYPIPFDNGLEGHHYFLETIEGLVPGGVEESIFFTRDKNGEFDFQFIEIVRVQPFILGENGKVLCQDSVIEQVLNNNCDILL